MAFLVGHRDVDKRDTLAKVGDNLACASPLHRRDDESGLLSWSNPLMRAPRADDVYPIGTIWHPEG